MSTIPELRSELMALSRKHKIPRLAEISEELKRRKPKDVAERESQPITPEIAAQVRSFKKLNPRHSQAAIAREFNVNPGRISEILNGKRK